MAGHEGRGLPLARKRRQQFERRQVVGRDDSGDVVARH